MNTPIEDYINYRIKRADESLEEARLLAKNESWNATINRFSRPDGCVLENRPTPDTR